MDKSSLLEKACRIEEKWRARGVSMLELMELAESSLEAYHMGLDPEEVFLDYHDWENLLHEAGVENPGPASTSACELLKKLKAQGPSRPRGGDRKSVV